MQDAAHLESDASLSWMGLVGGCGLLPMCARTPRFICACSHRYGTVRRIQAAPGPHPSLYSPPEQATPIKARVAVLFQGTISVSHVM